MFLFAHVEYTLPLRPNRHWRPISFNLCPFFDDLWLKSNFFLIRLDCFDGHNHLLHRFCFSCQLHDLLVILVVSEVIGVDVADHGALGLLAILLDELLDLL